MKKALLIALVCLTARGMEQPTTEPEQSTTFDVPVRSKDDTSLSPEFVALSTTLMHQQEAGLLFNDNAEDVVAIPMSNKAAFSLLRDLEQPLVMLNQLREKEDDALRSELEKKIIRSVNCVHPRDRTALQPLLSEGQEYSVEELQRLKLSSLTNLADKLDIKLATPLLLRVCFEKILEPSVCDAFLKSENPAAFNPLNLSDDLLKRIGKRIAIEPIEQLVRTWQPDVVARLEHDGLSVAAATSDRRLLVTGSYDKLLVWRYNKLRSNLMLEQSIETTNLLQHKIRDLAVSPQGKFIYVITTDNTLHQFEFEQNEAGDKFVLDTSFTASVPNTKCTIKTCTDDGQCFATDADNNTNKLGKAFIPQAPKLLEGLLLRNKKADFAFASKDHVLLVKKSKTGDPFYPITVGKQLALLAFLHKNVSFQQALLMHCAQREMCTSQHFKHRPLEQLGESFDEGSFQRTGILPIVMKLVKDK